MHTNRGVTEAFAKFKFFFMGVFSYNKLEIEHPV